MYAVQRMRTFSCGFLHLKEEVMVNILVYISELCAKNCWSWLSSQFGLIRLHPMYVCMYICTLPYRHTDIRSVARSSDVCMRACVTDRRTRTRTRTHTPHTPPPQHRNIKEVTLRPTDTLNSSLAHTYIRPPPLTNTHIHSFVRHTLLR